MLDLVPFTGIFDDIIKLISEAIPDKDKQAELTIRTVELRNQLTVTVLQTQTIPWVDALVKVIASLNIFMRPIGSALMTAAGIWMHYKQIPTDTGVQMLLDGAFPAWGTSRHFGKQQEQETQRIKIEKQAEIEKERINTVRWGKENQ